MNNYVILMVWRDFGVLFMLWKLMLLLLFRFAVFGHYCILAKTSNIDLKRLILFCFVLLSFQTFPAPPLHLFFNTCPNKAHFSQSIPLVSTTANFVLSILSPCFVAVCFTRFILSIKATCFFRVLIFTSQKNVCISFILCTAPLRPPLTFHPKNTVMRTENGRGMFSVYTGRVGVMSRKTRGIFCTFVIL